MILKAYQGISWTTYPLVKFILSKRRKKGKEDAIRYRERMGIYTVPRPEGQLIWLHGASVGECLSMMPLINRLVEEKNTTVLVTSGTVTSAELMAKRLPKGAFHQYIPVEYPLYARRFIRHFKPDLALFFESDFWPNLLIETKKANIPLVLLNGRISDKSFKDWKKALWFVRPMLSLFTDTLGQTEEDANRLRILGAKHADCVGNLKFAAVPAPYSEEELSSLKKQIGSRFVWEVGSTHDNEEEMAVDIHLRLKKKYPDILTIIVPRHPNRCDDIEKMIRAKGLSVHRRSRKEDMNADIFLGDTIGEMGLYYRLAPVVFVGGSLVPFGGQNMLEPMRIGQCTVIGPYAFNFKEIVEKSLEKGALIKVETPEELEKIVEEMTLNESKRSFICEQGKVLATSETTVLERVFDYLKKWMK